jgi:hypothetical protein
MIKNVAKFFCLIPLLVGIAGASIISSTEASYNPPNELKEQAQDCLEKIIEKQKKIQKEIHLIKDIIKQKNQNQTLPKNQNHQH